MFKTRALTNRLNVRIYRLVTKFITPVALLVGLLLLAVFHFRGVLATTRAQDDLFRGQKAYSLGPLGFDFVENAGTNRPVIAYNGTDVLAYVDWNSSIAVDGHVSNLWDNFHGYDFDRANADARQFFATTSGDGWQVVEVVTLVDEHTVTVHYAFVARPVGAAEPHQVTLSIAHLHRTLYQPTIQGNTLTAEVLPAYFQSVSFGHTPSPIGTLRVAVSGPQAPAGKAISLDDPHGTVDTHGAQYALANSFTTTYSIANPQVNRLVPLGTETVTFTTAIAAGTPIPAPVSTPAVAPLP